MKYLPFMLVGVFVLRGWLVRQRVRARVDRLRVVFDCAARRRPSPAAAHAVLRRELGGLPAVEGDYDAQQVASTASEAITVAIRNTLTIAFMLAYLLWMNWQLTLIAFAAFRWSATRSRRSTSA